MYFYLNVFLCVYNVEVKIVDKYWLDEKDLRYFEICVKGVLKRGENRWNKWWWYMYVMKVYVLVYIWGWKIMYFILCINKCYNYFFLWEINIILVIVNYCYEWFVINMVGK